MVDYSSSRNDIGMADADVAMGGSSVQQPDPRMVAEPASDPAATVTNAAMNVKIQELKNEIHMYFESNNVLFKELIE